MQLRVSRGGHDVPAEKIGTRYERSLKLLPAALKVCDRAFMFDNSGHEIVYVAEQQDGRILTTGTSVPRWLQRALSPGL